MNGLQDVSLINLLPTMPRKGGWWPRTSQFVRGAEEILAMQPNPCQSFLNINVNLFGSEVYNMYEQRIYENVDCVVGYRFCNVLYRAPDGGLRVDLDMLNDVKEQKGEGGILSQIQSI